MTVPGASMAFGAGAVDEHPTVVALVYTFTTSTGAVTLVRGHPQFVLSGFTAGVASLTFPKYFTFLSGEGVHDTDSATAANRYDLKVRNVNLAAGTAVVRMADESNGATNNSAPTGSIRLQLTVGE